LANTFRRVLDIQGTPIRMEFRQGDNPFREKEKEIRHSSKRRADAVERTANKRAIKLDKARKQLRKSYQKPK
jgi:GTP-binding protein